MLPVQTSINPSKQTRQINQSIHHINESINCTIFFKHTINRRNKKKLTINQTYYLYTPASPRKSKHDKSINQSNQNQSIHHINEPTTCTIFFKQSKDPTKKKNTINQSSYCTHQHQPTDKTNSTNQPITSTNPLHAPTKSINPSELSRRPGQQTLGEGKEDKAV